jgi:hypothetical protein
MPPAAAFMGMNPFLAAKMVAAATAAQPPPMASLFNPTAALWQHNFMWMAQMAQMMQHQQHANPFMAGLFATPAAAALVGASTAGDDKSQTASPKDKSTPASSKMSPTVDEHEQSRSPLDMTAGGRSGAKKLRKSIDSLLATQTKKLAPMLVDPMLKVET